MATAENQDQKPKILFNFKYCFCGRFQSTVLHPAILIIADDKPTAEALLTQEDNNLASIDRGIGYVCVQEIVLDKPMNLNLVLV